VEFAFTVAKAEIALTASRLIDVVKLAYALKLELLCLFAVDDNDANAEILTLDDLAAELLTVANALIDDVIFRVAEDDVVANALIADVAFLVILEDVVANADMELEDAIELDVDAESVANADCVLPTTVVEADDTVANADCVLPTNLVADEDVLANAD